MKARIEQLPYSVRVTGTDPVDTLGEQDDREFSFPFGSDGEDYHTREEATRAAEWFVGVVAPIL